MNWKGVRFNEACPCYPLATLYIRIRLRTQHTNVHASTRIDIAYYIRIYHVIATYTNGYTTHNTRLYTSTRRQHGRTYMAYILRLYTPYRRHIGRL